MIYDCERALDKQLDGEKGRSILGASSNADSRQVAELSSDILLFYNLMSLYPHPFGCRIQ